MLTRRQPAYPPPAFPTRAGPEGIGCNASHPRAGCLAQDAVTAGHQGPHQAAVRQADPGHDGGGWKLGSRIGDAVHICSHLPWLHRAVLGMITQAITGSGGRTLTGDTDRNMRLRDFGMWLPAGFSGAIQGVSLGGNVICITVRVSVTLARM